MGKILKLLIVIMFVVCISPRERASLAAQEVMPLVLESQRVRAFIAECPGLLSTEVYISYHYDSDTENSYRAVREFDERISSLLSAIDEEKNIISIALKTAAKEDEARRNEGNSTTGINDNSALTFKIKEETLTINEQTQKIDLAIRREMLSALIKIANAYEPYQKLIDETYEEFENSPDEYKGPYGVWWGNVCEAIDISPIERERDTECHHIWLDYVTKARALIEMKLGYAALLDDLRKQYFSSMNMTYQAEALQDFAQLAVAGEYLGMTWAVVGGARSGNVEYLKSVVTVTLDKKSYLPGEEVTVSVSGIKRDMLLNDKPVFGIYAPDAKHGEPVEPHTYISDNPGSLRLDAPAELGAYEIRLYTKRKEHTDATFAAKTTFYVEER